MSESQGNQQEKIREMAYRLWEEAGSPQGRQDEFWRLAEDRLTQDEGTSVPNDDLDIAGEHSFPASDPVNHT